MTEILTISNGIIGINLIVFLLVQSNQQLLNRLLFVIERVRHNKEYDRLLFSGFTHHSLLHLLFNMLALYSFGPFLEEVLGPVLMLTVFLLSIVGGNLFCLFLKNREPHYAALGASGGLFGLIYAAIYVQPTIGISLFFIPYPIPGWILGIGLSCLSILLSQLPKSKAALISHEGHLGGALTGSLLMMGIYPLLMQYPIILYFVLGGVLPILLMLLVKWIRPDLLYRH